MALGLCSETHVPAVPISVNELWRTPGSPHAVILPLTSPVHLGLLIPLSGLIKTASLRAPAKA